MIVKICIIVALHIAAEVSGASFSNVYVQSSPVISPPLHLEYGVPSSIIANPQIRQLSGADFASLFPLVPNYEVPCTPSPCIIPDRPVAPVAAVVPSTNVIANKSPTPTIPVFYSPAAKERSGYEYMYTIYSQQTGDHKLHSETSDGAIVRGEYAFLQPDGLVREVQYVADDVNGFKAIVKNCLPVEKTKLIVPYAQPCPELTTESTTAQNQHQEVKEEPPVAAAEGQNSHGDAVPPVPEVPVLEEIHETKPQEEPESHAAVYESLDNQQADQTPAEEHPAVVEPPAEEHKEVAEPSIEEHQEAVEPPKEEHLESNEGTVHEDIIIVQETPSEPEPAMGGEETVAETNQAATVELAPIEDTVYVPYNDVIKCIQAAMTKLNDRRPVSPLTYLVFNKPC